MKLLELSKNILIEKTELRQKNSTEWETFKYTGSLYDDFIEIFNVDTEITFDASYKAVKSINDLKKEMTKSEFNYKKISMKIESLIGSIKYITNIEKHDEISKNIEKLEEERFLLRENLEELETEFLFKNISILKIKIIDDIKSYSKREDFENMEFITLTNILVLVNNFLSKRERVVPLLKK